MAKDPSIEETFKAALKQGLFALAGVSKRAGAAVLASVAKDVSRTAREVDKRVKKFRDGVEKIVEMPGDDIDDDGDEKDDWRKPGDR